MANIAKRDFEIYAKGVSRLEELEKEINLLNVDKKFPSEIASIRSKLKHVSEIPQIEYELKILKDKISGKERKKTTSKSESASKAKIRVIEEQIKRKTAECRKFAPLSKEVLKLKLEIDSMRGKIKEYENEKKRKSKILETINSGVGKVFDNAMDLSLNDIKAKLSREVDSKEAAVQKELQNDLIRREELFKEKYNQLENEFHKKYAQKVKDELKKEVSSKFDEKINDELSKKAKASENELNSLKRKLKNEYASKERILNEHFEKAIAEEKKRQKETFDEKLLAHKINLHKKLDSEIAKEVLRIKESESVKQHELNEKLSGISKLREKLIESFRKKKESLENQDEAIMGNKLSEIEREKKKALDRIAERQKEQVAERLRLASLNNRIILKSKKEIEKEKETLSNEKRELEESLIKQEEAIKRKAEALKARLQAEYKEKIKEGEKVKESIEDEKIKEQEKIARQEEAIKRKAEAIKARLQAEYEQRLKEGIKAKETELKKKNLDLEKEIQKKVKMFYH